MIVLIDANVLLDVFLNRQPWLTAARRVVDANQSGEIIGCIAATTVTNIHYLTRRLASAKAADEAVDTCLQNFLILAVDARVLEAAQRHPGSDFEDNVQLAAGVIHRAEAIVSRDAGVLATSPLQAFTPDALLAKLGL